MAKSQYDLRPSSAPVWVICTGSIYLSVPEMDEEADASIREEGTACHWAAYQLSQGRQVSIGDTAENGLKIDAEMLSACGLYLHTTCTYGPGYYETSFGIPDIHPRCGGTPDFFAYDAATNTITIVDLKYGFRTVDVIFNLQLLCYALGAARYFGIDPYTANYRFCIVQPRRWDPAGYVREWSAPAAKLLPEWQKLRAAADRYYSGDVTCTINPGCKHCSGSHRCSLLRDVAFDAADIAQRAIGKDLPFPIAERELVQVNKALEILEAFKSGLESQVTYEIRNGKKGEHYSLETGLTAAKWKPGCENLAAAFAQNIGAKITKPQQLITPTQAAKIIGPDVVSMYAARETTPPKLVPLKESRFIKIFSKDK